MTRVAMMLACSVALTGCLAGNMVRDLSLKGKPLTLVEQRYGRPDQQEAVAGGSRSVWNARDGRHPCTLLVTADPTGRVTDVKMVGRNDDCYRFGNGRPGAAGS